MLTRVPRLACVLLLTLPLSAAELDRSCTELPRHARLNRAMADLLVPGQHQPEATADGVRVELPSSHYLVARIGQDGKPVIVCVDDEKQVRRFLESTEPPASRAAQQEQ